MPGFRVRRNRKGTGADFSVISCLARASLPRNGADRTGPFHALLSARLQTPSGGFDRAKDTARLEAWRSRWRGTRCDVEQIEARLASRPSIEMRQQQNDGLLLYR